MVLLALVLESSYWLPVLAFLRPEERLLNLFVMLPEAAPRL